MNKLVFFILLLIVFGCASPASSKETESLNTKFYVTEVYQAKYSRVIGYIFYNGIKVPADNGTTGYYYKEYKLKPGDVVGVTVQIDKNYTYLWGSQFVDMLGYRTFEFGIHLCESKNNTKVEIFHTILGHEPYVKGVLNNALPFMQEKCRNGLTGENFTSLQLYDWVMK